MVLSSTLSGPVCAGTQRETKGLSFFFFFFFVSSFFSFFFFFSSHPIGALKQHYVGIHFCAIWHPHNIKGVFTTTATHDMCFSKHLLTIQQQQVQFGGCLQLYNYHSCPQQLHVNLRELLPNVSFLPSVSSLEYPHCCSEVSRGLSPVCFAHSLSSGSGAGPPSAGEPNIL